MSDDSSSQAHPLRPRKGSKNPFRSDLEMKTRLLGRTGLKVSEIGFGAWAIGGRAHGELYWPPGEVPSKPAVWRGAERRVEIICTPPRYRLGPNAGTISGTSR